MSWQELKRIVETNDLDHLVDWVETNKELIDQQVLRERVQKLFNTERFMFEHDATDPFYDDYMAIARVGLNWKCSDAFWDFLLSRSWPRNVSIEGDSVLEDLYLDGERRLHVDEKWDQDETYSLYRQIRYILQDPRDKDCVQVEIEVSLNKDFQWLGTIQLPEIPFSPEMNQEEVHARAREMFLSHRSELYRLAKDRYEQGYDPDLEGT